MHFSPTFQIGCAPCLSWNLDDRSSKSTATGPSSTLPTTTRRARCMANDRYLSCPSFSHPTLTISWRIGDNISVRVRNQTTFSFVKVEQQSIDIVHGLQHCFTSMFPVHGQKDESALDAGYDCHPRSQPARDRTRIANSCCYVSSEISTGWQICDYVTSKNQCRFGLLG